MRKTGSAGKPYPYVDVRLSDEERAAGARAERLRRLLAQPGGDRRGVLRDGWLHTGDIAELDEEGYYRILGRLKDMFISGGENVYPAEVESALHEHPPSPRPPSSACRTSAGARSASRSSWPREQVAEDELVEHCRDRLARYKVPKRVDFVDALPQSAMNKVLKSELRARVERGGDGVTGPRPTPLPTNVEGKELTSRGAATRTRAARSRRDGASPSSATTTRRSSRSPRRPASPRARSTSTSPASRRSSRSSCAT